jgi:hypothetical protein
MQKMFIDHEERSREMIKYGLRIGNVGVEFSDRGTREKALLIFTKGSCVKISDCEGRKYTDHDGAFSTYEANTEEQTMNCSKCKGSFSSEACTQRNVPATGWNGKFKGADEKESKFLCDACHAKILADFEVFNAKKVIENAEN